MTMTMTMTMIITCLYRRSCFTRKSSTDTFSISTRRDFVHAQEKENRQHVR